LKAFGSLSCMHTGCFQRGASGVSATAAVSSMLLCMHVCAWSGAFVAHGLGWTDDSDAKVGDDVGVLQWKTVFYPTFLHNIWHGFEVLLILYAILLNKVTQDLLRYTAQNLETTGYMHSKQTQIAQFNFVQCLTNYSKSSAVHIADEQSVVLHKLSWFVATMDWMRFV